LPPLYLEGEPVPRQVVPIQVFGLSEHGKTVYLSALTMTLRRMNCVWRDAICMPATAVSQRKVLEINEYLRTGQLPPLTPLGKSECFILMLRNMVPWGRKALVIRDCSGEAFGEMDVKVDEASYFLVAPTTFMFFSLSDSNLIPGFTIDMLMNNYLNTLVSKGVRFDQGKRKIILILTKPDKLKMNHVLPEALWKYVECDPIWPLLDEGVLQQPLTAENMEEYLGIMRKASVAIEDWVGATSAGATLISLAREYHVELSFSIVWGTGWDDGLGSAQNVVWRPARVLDPLFWALEMSGR
jgi:hypothetical protein